MIFILHRHKQLRTLKVSREEMFNVRNCFLTAFVFDAQEELTRVLSYQSIHLNPSSHYQIAYYDVISPYIVPLHVMIGIGHRPHRQRNHNGINEL